MKTQSAQAAQEIRKELKINFPGIKFKVTSKSYSMGSNVNISWFDGPTSQEVDLITAKYQYGHFDSMNDIYEYSNVNKDLPQVKHMFTHREMSEEIKNVIRKELQMDINENEYYTKWNCYGHTVLRRFFNDRSLV